MRALGEMQTRQTFTGADAVRGFSCLSVLIVYGIVINIPESNLDQTGCGKDWRLAVFVLSAFLLTYSFFEDGFSRFSLLAYAVGRILRIYPV